MPESHHHHDPSDHSHTHSREGGRRVMIADGLHNTADGIILASAFALDIRVGVVVTIGIVVHEIVQEISEFFVLREAGYTAKEALIKNFFVSATILIGIAIGTSLSQVAGFESLLIGLAAGGFLYVVFLDLVPHSFEKCHSRHSFLSHGFAAVLGIVLMFGINSVSAFAHIEQVESENIFEGKLMM